MRHFLTAWVILVVCGCTDHNEWDCLKSMGTETSEIRHTGNFEKVFMSDRINVSYRYSDTCYVEVKFGKNIIDRVKTRADNHILNISNTATCNWVRDLKKVPLVIIYAPSLMYISNASSANLMFEDTLTANDFWYEQYSSNGEVNLLLNNKKTRIYAHTGYSDIQVAGKTHHAGLYNASVGKMDATQLVADTAIVNNTSLQDLKCTATTYLFGEINLSGNILYRGNPTVVETSINGSGSVIPQY